MAAFQDMFVYTKTLLNLDGTKSITTMLATSIAAGYGMSDAQQNDCLCVLNAYSFFLSHVRLQ